MEEHEKIKKLIEHRIIELQKCEENEKVKQELEKMNALLRLITTSNRDFFGEINVDVAVAILSDIGIDKKNTLDSYAKLIKEEIDSKYKLLNIELEEEER